MTITEIDPTLRQQLEERLRSILPAMEADGGGVEIVSLGEGRLVLRLKGACLYCPSQPLTLNTTLLPAIREVLPPEFEVTFLPN